MVYREKKIISCKANTELDKQRFFRKLHFLFISKKINKENNVELKKLILQDKLGNVFILLKCYVKSNHFRIKINVAICHIHLISRNENFTV